MKKRKKQAPLGNSPLEFGIKFAQGPATLKPAATPPSNALLPYNIQGFGGTSSALTTPPPAPPARTPAVNFARRLADPTPLIPGPASSPKPQPRTNALTAYNTYGAAGRDLENQALAQAAPSAPKPPANATRAVDLARRLADPRPLIPRPPINPQTSALNAYNTYGAAGRDLENQALAQATAPPPPAAPPTPIQQELRARQTALAEARARSEAAARAESGDWWANQLSATDYLTDGGARSFGENVAYPARQAVGQGVGAVSQTLKNQGVRGAGLSNTINSGIGQWGKWLTSPWSAPKPFTDAELKDYRALQAANTLGERRMTPEELSRASAYDERQRALNQERVRQDYWDTYSTQAVNDSDKAFATAKEVTDMLDRGDSFDGVKAEIVKSPGGQQQVATVPVDPILREKQRLNEQAGYNESPSTLGALSNVTYGVGDAASQAAPGMMALSGVGTAANTVRALNAARAGGAMAGLNTAANSANMFNPAVTLNPLNVTTLPGALGYGGAMIGGATAAPGLAEAFGSNDAQQQMDAGAGLFNNSLTGGFLGTAAGSLAPAALANRVYPATAAATQATTAAAPASSLLNRAVATAAPPVAVGAAAGYADGARRDAQMQADDQASEVEPNAQAIAEQQQQPGAASTLDMDRISPAFAGAASRVNAGKGTGQVGTPVMGRPDLGQQGVVRTEEDSDFYNWMQSSDAYRTPDGKPGAIETQALGAGQAAYNDVFQKTGSKQQALEAQQVAYAQTYTGAYRKDQSAQYETSAQQLEKLFGDNAPPEQIQTQAQKTMQHLVRSDPQNAEQVKQYTQWLDAQQRGEPVDNPAAVATDEAARKSFAAQAAKAAPAAGAAQNDPNAFGQYMGGIMDQFNNLPTEAKAAIGIGLPLALVGMLMNASGEGGGLDGMLFTVLGLGAAGLGAAGSGMLGDGAQQMVGSGIGGLAKLFGANIPKDGVDLSALLSKDVVGDITAQAGGGGVGGKLNALWNLASGNADVEGKLKQVDQLKQLTSLPSFIAIPMLRSLDPKNIQTAEQAQLAYNNAMKLRQQLDDPKSQLAQMINQGRQLVDSKKQLAAGVDKAKSWASDGWNKVVGAFGG